MTVATRGGVGSRLLAAMSYLGILCLIPLMVNRDDEYVAFHARQGLVLWIWAVVAFVAVAVPGFGPAFFRISSMAIPVLALAGLVSVLANRAWMLPLVYGLARRL
ncbi:MAG: hypothetical protein H7840_02475 [Alphaproteobacteria bacterium]